MERDGVVAEQLTYGPAGELLYRQVGEKFIFYVGEYMTVRASGATGCASSGTCALLPATVEADYHVLLAATRIVSVSPSRTLYYYRSRLGNRPAADVLTAAAYNRSNRNALFTAFASNEAGSK